jgi:high affinity choline transporter 7
MGFGAMLFFYALVFFIGSYIAGRQKGSNSDEEVMLAGRALPLWIAVFTMSATWIGGGYINGTAEATYGQGLIWAQAPWCYALSLILGGLLFARKMRRLGFRTMLDPLEQRFGKKTTALLFLPALSGELFWSAAILVALGTTFAAVLGLGFEFSIILSALIIVVYTVLGGLWAVALTDVIQLILLILGLIITVPFCLEAVGGWELAWAKYQTKMGPAGATLLPDQSILGNQFWTWWDYAFLLILGGIPWQVYFQRVLAAKDEQTAVRLSIIAGLVCLAVAVPPVMIGVAGGVADWAGAGAPHAPQGAEVLPFVMRYLTHPLVATIGLGAVAAAVMASADSSILSAASMMAWNVYKPLVKPKVHSTQLVKMIQRSIWVVGLAVTLIALKVQSVAMLWILSSDFVYCLLFPALFAAFFDPKANWIGVLAGFGLAFILRFGGGDANLGIPCLLPYPLLDPAVELNAQGERIAVLLPFRSIATLGGILAIALVSRLTQRQAPAKALQYVGEEDKIL